VETARCDLAKRFSRKNTCPLLIIHLQHHLKEFMTYRRFAALACTLLTGVSLSAQTNTFPASGNVAIGTNNPRAPLHVTGGVAMAAGWNRTAVLQATFPVLGFNAGGTHWAGIGYDPGHAMRFWIQGTSEDIAGTSRLAMSIGTNGNVGIGSHTPNHELDVNGDVMARGALRIGELYFSPAQFIQLSVGTERWIKLATIPNNHYVRFHLRNGSQNSEEIAEVKVFGTYHNERTAISVERQTYNEHLREVRVVGSYGAPRTVYVKIRASDYAPSVSWRALDSRGAITIHNIEETPGEGLSHYVSGNLVTSTNTNLVTTGNVGIGATNPGSKLDIGGPTGAMYGTLAIKQASAGQKGIWLQSYENNNAISIHHTGSYAVVSTDYTGTGTCVPLALQVTGGNVGIGETNPQHKLAVNGTIKAKEIIVETTGWSDYVFADDYRLAPLAEVEAHIKTNKHLPGIPSAAEVAEQGVSVGELQAKLLAKIEELTLHQIAQEKFMHAQAEELSALRAKVACLEKTPSQ
jgi:hypothetical protein